MCLYFVFKSTNSTFHYKFHDGFVLEEIFHVVVEWGVAYICTYWHILVHMCVYVLFKSANPTFHYKFRDGFVLTEIFHFNRRMVYIWTYSYILAHMCVYFVFKSTNPTFHYTFRDGFVLNEIFHCSSLQIQHFITHFTMDSFWRNSTRSAWGARVRWQWNLGTQHAVQGSR